MDPEEDEELPALAVQPVGPDLSQQEPLGADAYDRAAALLQAARAEGTAIRMGWPTPPLPGEWDGQTYIGAQQEVQDAVGPGRQVMPAPVTTPGAPAQSDYQAQLAALMARIERNQQMQEQGVEAAFERSKPSESEKWLGIAAALASPTQYGSFGETMGNVFNALIQHKQGVRKAESTRQSELARLRQAYDIAGINAAARGLKPPTAASRPRLLVNPLTGEPMDPHTGRTLKQPNDKAWSLLRANPTDGSLASFLREFPQYEEEAKAIVDQARQQRGGL